MSNSRLLVSKKLSLISGMTCGLSFAPIYFLPAVFAISILFAQVLKAQDVVKAAAYGYWFGFGFFLTALYWISFGILVYIDEFWWVLPIAMLGLPAFLALFLSVISSMAWYARANTFYHPLFCILWVLMEWLMSWLFTGLPWALIGYALTVSDYLMQSASIVGILGLSLCTVFIGSAIFTRKLLILRLAISILLILAMGLYGHYRLQHNTTQYSDIKVRIVQPSIVQSAKWDTNLLWSNLNQHITLSLLDGVHVPDIIIWSEAALTVPFYHQSIYEALQSALTHDKQVLITGGIDDNGLFDEKYKIYTSMLALNKQRGLIFSYNKAHLVPFGEYMPMKDYIPIKKITDGVMDYSPGIRQTVHLGDDINLMIHPLICYESIFFDEVRITNKNADVIINITNDAWYGKSSGPFQHFEISRMRAVENGLPMLRASNNGISAVVDPLGRIVARLALNEVNIIDSYIPLKLDASTFYSQYGNLAVVALCILMLMIYIVIAKVAKAEPLLRHRWKR